MVHIPACSKATNGITKSRVRDTRRIFYGWWIVLAGCIATALSSGLFFTGFGFFFEPIRIHFGWSRTILSWAMQFSVLGARTPVLTSMRGDYFGRTAFASIMGTSQSIAIVSMIISPPIVGYCADHYSYELGFYLISALTAPGFLLLLSLDKRSPKY